MIERILRVAKGFDEAREMDGGGPRGGGARAAEVDRVEAEFVARPLYVIGRAALLKNKRAAGRTKDLLDVALLEESKPPRKGRR